MFTGIDLHTSAHFKNQSYSPNLVWPRCYVYDMVFTQK